MADFPESSHIKDLDDPFIVHHSDGPTTTLVSPFLTRDNYSTWVHPMTISLRTKNKLEFINRIIEKAVGPSLDFQKWQRCNDLVSSWILHSIIKELVNNILYE